MEGEKLRIAMINNTREENPSYVVRNKIVAQGLRELGHEVFCESTAYNFDHDDYDVFIFNRFYEGTLIKMIGFLKSIGKTVIYETDDNYEAIDENNPFMKIKDYSVLSSRELIKMADGITVSTPELKAEIYNMFPDIKDKINVIPNALDFSQYKKRKGKNKKLRIGFQGSNIHVQDLLIAIDAIEQLQKEYVFEFYIFGIDDRPFKELNKFCLERKEKWKWMEDFPKLYEKLEKIEYKHIPTCSYEKYRDKLSELNFDIGIAPLTDTRFNRSKSCLKFYEYAAVRTVTLASRVIPYSQEMDQEDLVKNRHDKWVSKLRKLIEDETYRQQRLYAQEAWVNEMRDIKKIAKQWEQVIINIKNKDEKNIIGR
jgi:glycosyltransferase involved in cell wall biosynthesis